MDPLMPVFLFIVYGVTLFYFLIVGGPVRVWNAIRNVLERGTDRMVASRSEYTRQGAAELRGESQGVVHPASELDVHRALTVADVALLQALGWEAPEATARRVSRELERVRTARPPRKPMSTHPRVEHVYTAGQEAPVDSFYLE